jgi:hypothetical protein
VSSGQAGPGKRGRELSRAGELPGRNPGVPCSFDVDHFVAGEEHPPWLYPIAVATAWQVTGPGLATPGSAEVKMASEALLMPCSRRPAASADVVLDTIATGRCWRAAWTRAACAGRFPRGRLARGNRLACGGSVLSDEVIADRVGLLLAGKDAELGEFMTWPPRR